MNEIWVEEEKKIIVLIENEGALMLGRGCGKFVKLYHTTMFGR